MRKFATLIAATALAGCAATDRRALQLEHGIGIPAPGPTIIYTGTRDIRPAWGGSLRFGALECVKWEWLPYVY